MSKLKITNEGKVGESAAEWVALSKLKPWGQNPRKITEKAIEKVAASIKEFGFSAPILARRANCEIIAGHTRYRAALLLNMQSAPARFLDLTERQAHLLAIADNKLGEFTEWNDALLASVLGEYAMEHDDAAEVAGFTDSDIERLIEQNVRAMTDGSDGGVRMGEKLSYQVLIECKDEQQQAELISKLEAAGVVCKPLIV